MLAVADAADPWFQRFKDVIGEFHWTPQEALVTVAPEAQARSVVCWSMPIGEAARKANRREEKTPARAWSYARNFSTALLARLAGGLAGTLQEMGFAAIAPAQSPDNDVGIREGVGLAARWSERHAAFVAGLGTFGISGGLITPHGIAHRLGSVVTEAPIPPTARPYGDDPFAWCLKISQDTCGACIRRCPAGAVGETIESRDKEACRRHIRSVSERASEAFGFTGGFDCFLCHTAVPCEDRIPCEPKPSG